MKDENLTIPEYVWKTLKKRIKKGNKKRSLYVMGHMSLRKDKLSRCRKYTTYPENRTIKQSNISNPQYGNAFLEKYQLVREDNHFIFLAL